MTLERPGEHIALAREARVVEPRPAADALVDRHADEPAHKAGRRRRIGDAHFPETDRVGAERGVVIDARRARKQRGLHFFARHRALTREIARAGADGNVDEPRQRTERGYHARVDDFQRAPGHAADRVDRRAARDEIGDHLRRDGLRIGAHAFVGNPVIGREHDHCGPSDRGPHGLLDHADPARERFEHAEAAWGFRLRVDDPREHAFQRAV